MTTTISAFQKTFAFNAPATRAPALLLWGIIHNRATRFPFTIADYDSVITGMYPGIKYRKFRDPENGENEAYMDNEMHRLLEEHVIPDLRVKYPALVAITSEKKVPAQNMDIKVIKPCKAKEWKSWKTNFVRTELDPEDDSIFGIINFDPNKEI
jgi:hypothetical protein